MDEAKSGRVNNNIPHHQDRDSKREENCDKDLKVKIKYAESNDVELSELNQEMKENKVTTKEQNDNNDDDIKIQKTSHQDREKEKISCIESNDEKNIKLEDEVEIDLGIETTDINASKYTKNNILITDIIGQFGIIQFSLTCFTFVRFVIVALMTNSGLLLAPSIDFWCVPPELVDADQQYKNPSSSIYNRIITNKTLLNACKLEKPSFPKEELSYIECQTWIYNTNQTGVTLTSEFDLVCSREIYKSNFQSIVSFGIIASVLWASYSDTRGRYTSVLQCYCISALTSLVSILAPNLATFSISRTICSVADMGIAGASMSILAESLGTHRGTMLMIAYTGWSVGVVLMPLILDYCLNFRHSMLVLLAIHLLTFPWFLFTLRDSTRWLLINGKFNEAKNEFKRILYINSLYKNNIDWQSFEYKYSLIKSKYEPIAKKKYEHKQKLMRQFNNGYARRFSILIDFYLQSIQIFKSKVLIKSTLASAYILMNSDLFYNLTIMINSYFKDQIILVYMLGGFMELLSTVSSIIAIYYLTRRSALILTLSATTVSCVAFALSFGSSIQALVWFNFAKFIISTVSSLIILVVYEIFPTSLRQTGFGFATLLSAPGAVLAPYLEYGIKKELDQTDSPFSKLLIATSLIPLTSVAITIFFLPETSNSDIKDEIDE